MRAGNLHGWKNEPREGREERKEWKYNASFHPSFPSILPFFQQQNVKRFLKHAATWVNYLSQYSNKFRRHS